MTARVLRRAQVLGAADLLGSPLAAGGRETAETAEPAPRAGRRQAAASDAPAAAAARPEAAGAGRREAAELAALAAEAGRRLADAPAEAVLEWAAGTFGERFCVTSSFADAVLVHLASRVVPGAPVVFLDTGLHFAETLRVRDQVARSLPVRVVTVRPELTVAEQDARYGPRLYARAPDRCCALRKVAPLARALEPYDAWATGLRRDESPSRAGTAVVGFDRGRGMVKLAPLAAWTGADVAAYVTRHDVPVNALVDQGYPSVGCWPCTRPVAPGQDPRSGRWPLFEKTECGIHAS